MRVVTGYLFLALSVLITLSVITFSPADSALFVSDARTLPVNMASWPGVWVSSVLVLLYGRAGALLLGFGVFTTGINLLVGNKLGRVLAKMTMFMISVISLSVVIAALKTGADFTDSGISGLAITTTLGRTIPAPVIGAVFGLLFLLSLISTMKLFKRLTVLLGKAVGALILAPFELFGMIVREKRETVMQPQATPAPETMAVFFPAEKPQQTVTTVMDQAMPEPSFLKTGQYQDQAEPHRTPLEAASSGDIEAPAWLSHPSGKSAIMREMEEKFNPHIDPEWKPAPKPRQEEAVAADDLSDDFIPEPEELELTPPIKPLYQTLEREVEPAPFITPPVENTGRDSVMAARISGEELPQEDDALDELPALPLAGEAEEITGEADYVAEREKTAQPAEELFSERETAAVTSFIFPSAQHLEKSFDDFSRVEETQEIENISRVIENTFASFKIDIKVSGYSRGPAITRYEIVPPTGLKLKNIVNLTDDLALNLGSRNIRIVAPIGNRSIIGVEVPNKYRRSVVLRDIIESSEFIRSKAKLPLILGKDIAGNIVVEDLAEMPHLLIAGTTGSGKSVYVNSLIAGILFTRSVDEVKFIFIDPKMVELELYNGIPHLLAPVITSPEEAIGVLEWASGEMDRRYKILSEWGVRNITDYNREVKKANGRKKKEENRFEVFPFLVIVIDEFANLMLRLPKETEKVISRIAAMARAVGIHLVVATQRPSVDVVTGIIKANFPSRIAFRVSSQTDSRTILDRAGAEKLLGRGDMLFMTPNFTDMIRMQSPYVSNQDVETFVKDVKRNGTADYQIDLENLQIPGRQESSGSGDGDYTADYRKDPLYTEALKAAVENGEISASYLQRRFRIGYNRASRIMDAFDALKILGPVTAAGKPREVLITTLDLAQYLE